MHHLHEYMRNGTAKALTLFRPATGDVRVKGVTSATNAVLHAWLKTELSAILADLPLPQRSRDADVNRMLWESWREGLQVRVTVHAELPPLRLILIWDNLAGHYTPDLLCWMMDRGILPLYTPLGGSSLNMAESIQRILKRRALDGQNPTQVQEIIDWWEAIARGWNAHPTPFVWGGKRAQRRYQAWERRHAVGGSGAFTRYRIPPAPSLCAA